MIQSNLALERRRVDLLVVVLSKMNMMMKMRTMNHSKMRAPAVRMRTVKKARKTRREMKMRKAKTKMRIWMTASTRMSLRLFRRRLQGLTLAILEGPEEVPDLLPFSNRLVEKRSSQRSEL